MYDQQAVREESSRHHDYIQIVPTTQARRCRRISLQPRSPTQRSRHLPWRHHYFLRSHCHLLTHSPPRPDWHYSTPQTQPSR